MFSVTKSVTGRHQISDETGGFDHLDVTKTVTSLVYHLGGGSFPSLSTAENPDRTKVSSIQPSPAWEGVDKKQTCIDSGTGRVAHFLCVFPRFNPRRSK